MIPRHEGDDPNHVRVESPEVAVLDEVVRMLVMPFVADVVADIMQQGGVVEPLALAVAEMMLIPPLIDKRLGV